MKKKTIAVSAPAALPAGLLIGFIPQHLTLSNFAIRQSGDSTASAQLSHVLSAQAAPGK